MIINLQFIYHSTITTGTAIGMLNSVGLFVFIRSFRLFLFFIVSYIVRNR